MRKIFLLLVLCLPSFLFGIEEETEGPLPIGNFSVSSATQLAPLISFGQTLIGGNTLLPDLFGNYTQGHDSYSYLILPNVIYGVRDDFSILASLPCIPKSKSGSSDSSGIGDLLLQLEYGYYSKSTKEYSLQATVVGNVQFPTGSSSKDPPTGTGSYTFLLGTTLAYLSYNWYAFVSPGVDLTTTHHGTKFGNLYLYQFGVARYIKALSPKGCIFDFMVEFDGAYAEKDKIHGETDPDSGGNVIFLTPSLWLSSNRWILQWGIGFPIVQNLNGHQDKIIYSISYNLGIALKF